MDTFADTVLNRSAETTGDAANEAEVEKRQKYGALEQRYFL